MSTPDLRLSEITKTTSHYADYVELCAAEGVEPETHHDFRKARQQAVKMGAIKAPKSSRSAYSPRRG